MEVPNQGFARESFETTTVQLNHSEAGCDSLDEEMDFSCSNTPICWASCSHSLMCHLSFRESSQIYDLGIIVRIIRNASNALYPGFALGGKSGEKSVSFQKVSSDLSKFPQKIARKNIFAIICKIVRQKHRQIRCVVAKFWPESDLYHGGMLGNLALSFVRNFLLSKNFAKFNDLSLGKSTNYTTWSQNFDFFSQEPIPRSEPCSYLTCFCHWLTYMADAGSINRCSL